MGFVESMRGLLRQKGLAPVREIKRKDQAPPDDAPTVGMPDTVQAAKPDRQAAWRELAALTAGLIKEDPRLPAVMDALLECQQAEDEGDGKAFQKAVARVRSAVKGRNLGEAL